MGALERQVWTGDTPEGVPGRVFNVQRYSLHDGPGIRTTVFLKGCALGCLWCANPESAKPDPELGFLEARCSRCGECFPVCPYEAITPGPEGLPLVDRQHCTACGDCVQACPDEALAVYGRQTTAGEVFAEVRRDAIFYEGSGGGVTVSGGEPLLQPRFVSALFHLCRQAGIHTAVETAGFVNPRILQVILPLTDYVLYDLKHLEAHVHQEVTGRSNHLILRNAATVAASGVPVLFRMPLVPGVNDTLDNIRKTASFLGTLGAAGMHLELLPYHRLGEGKYQALGRPYPLDGLKMPEMEQVESVRRAFEDLDIRCTVSR
jgi:pyruvate formate lyase activating enzyme